MMMCASLSVLFSTFRLVLSGMRGHISAELITIRPTHYHVRLTLVTLSRSWGQKSVRQRQLL